MKGADLVVKIRMEQLAYFVKTIEKGSINKAAKELFISQPALSKQLALLENELGSHLLYRKRTGIELTEPGRFLYERACLILAQMDETLKGMERFRQNLPVRVGSLPSLAHTFLPSLMAAAGFGKNNEVSVVVQDTSAQLAEMLRLNRLDIAFVQEESVTREFSTWSVFQEPYLAVLPSDHPLAKESAIDFDSFCQEDLLIHRDPCDIRKDFRKHCQLRAIQPKHMMEFDFNDSLVAFTAKGHGVSIVPQLVAEAFLHPSLVVKPFSEESSFSRTIYLISRPEAQEIALHWYEAAAALPSLLHSVE
ncbi:LysR family transcriptional regulator [Brevibacillus choshinensis]|uniref:LysR family transcriptional regulator n=1 Tax=Brevibacillus choshinensis TaxID=54911 RepID=UPI002E1F51B0|nr:LysR family transcriptional regulator [Brevibacillus choshinensis]